MDGMGGVVGLIHGVQHVHKLSLIGGPVQSQLIQPVAPGKGALVRDLCAINIGQIQQHTIHISLMFRITFRHIGMHLEQVLRVNTHFIILLLKRM